MQTVAQKLEADLTVIQRKRAELEALEAQYAKDLDEARAVQEGDASQIAALEPVVQEDVRTDPLRAHHCVLCMLSYDLGTSVPMVLPTICGCCR